MGDDNFQPATAPETPQPIFSMKLEIHCESKKTPTYVNNFAKYLSIFKIISLLHSGQYFLQNGHYTSNHTLKMLLHYLVKL